MCVCMYMYDDVLLAGGLYYEIKVCSLKFYTKNHYLGYNNTLSGTALTFSAYYHTSVL